MTNAHALRPAALGSSLENYRRVARSLRHGAWTMVLALAGISVALWLALEAEAEHKGWALENREVARLALAAQVAAISQESATRLALGLRDSASAARAERAGANAKLYLDSLARRAGDPVTAAHVRAIRVALGDWEREYGGPALLARAHPGSAAVASIAPQVLAGVALFGVVRGRFDELVQHQNRTYLERVLEEDPFALRRTLLLVAGVLVLAMLAWQMRRQVSLQIGDLVEGHRIIASQNRQLQTHSDVLEEQARTLEEQRSSLENQTMELEMAVEELREAEGRQQDLLDETQRLNRRLMVAQHVAQLGYWEVDQATGEVFWSDEMYEFCGEEPGLVPPPTDRYIACVHPDDRARFAAIAAAALANLSEFTEQYRITAPNGRSRTVQARGHLVSAENGAPRLVGTVQDITERVLLENQFRQSQKMEAVGRLAGGVAHDVNNMLTVVGGYAQLIALARPDDDVVEPFVREILDAIDRSASITRQLLVFSRGSVIEPRIVDINEAIRETQPLISRLIGEDVELDVRADSRALRTLADPTHITQVLMNLAVNARDAMPDGGRLVIETSTVVVDEAYTKQHPGVSEGHHVVIAVSDTGIGMDEATQARIFEPFFTTKSELRGTGLGLSTVLGIVQQTGGTIWVYSEPSRGTTFKIFLPLDGGSAGAEVPEQVATVERVRGATILLVEDDASLRRLTSRLLRRADYSVLEAADGAEALEVLRAHAADVVLTDTVMPRMGGRELANRLAVDHPAVSVVLTSGYTADMLQQHGPVPESIGFLEKPFTAETLDRAIQAALRAGSGRGRAAMGSSARPANTWS